ncbi:MAG TPA: diguanylate cyclase, partial [Fimbriimonadaceae bacterium]|nr:diguanylate cyclase [Fimbriimonadaceae bacterium]
YQEATPAMVQAYKTGLATADKEPTTDEWGTFISGYAPIRDETGNVIAISGVDLEASKYEQRLAAMTGAGKWTAFFIFLVTAIVGASAWTMQKNVLRTKKEQEEAKDALEDLAQNLDRANERLRSASRRFEQLFNLLPVACFTLDADGVIFEWNQECERLTGYPAPVVIQSKLVNYIEDPANATMFNDVLARAMAGEPTTSREWTDVSQDGRVYTAILSAFPLYATSGEVTGVIAACSDISVRKDLERKIEIQMGEIKEANAQLAESRSELERANAELIDVNSRLEQLAAIDGLTGLWNRRRSYEILTFEISNVKTTGLPLSILMLDIDHFKKLNDTCGHLAGDAVLKMVAASIKSQIRDQDSVGRYGGEEFIVVLPGCDEDAAKSIAERVRARIASHPYQGSDVTVSIGVSTCYDDAQEIEPFIGRADKALYAAKRRGRNCVIHVDEIKRSSAA